MSKIGRFEDIQAWQKAKELVKNIHKVTDKVDFARDYSLKDQVRRASVSVMSNIAEGYARHTDKEFVQFMYRFRFCGRGSEPTLHCSRLKLYNRRGF